MKKTAIVIGKARSGTSLTAGILYHLSVHMGKKLKSASDANEKGFFENTDILSFNIHSLEDNGFRINKSPLPDLDCLIPFKEEYREEAEKLIKEHKRKKIWGWKDPRTIWTFPLLSDFIENPYFIVNYRDFEAIAKSLKLRDRLPVKKGLALGKEYSKLVEKFFKKYKYPRLNVYYEKYFTAERDPQINAICHFLGIPYNVKASELVDPTIRHF